VPVVRLPLVVRRPVSPLGYVGGAGCGACLGERLPSIDPPPGGPATQPATWPIRAGLRGWLPLNSLLLSQFLVEPSGSAGPSPVLSEQGLRQRSRLTYLRHLKRRWTRLLERRRWPETRRSPATKVCQGEWVKPFRVERSPMREQTGWWLQAARRDLEAAGLLVQGGIFELASFHCHQAAEKSLRRYSSSEALRSARTPVWSCFHGFAKTGCRSQTTSFIRCAS